MQTRGHQYEYICISIDITSTGKFRMSNNDFAHEIIKSVPTDMAGVAPPPATNHLFIVNETNQTNLKGSDTKLLHHLFAKLLFRSK